MSGTSTTGISSTQMTMILNARCYFHATPLTMLWGFGMSQGSWFTGFGRDI